MSPSRDNPDRRVSPGSRSQWRRGRLQALVGPAREGSKGEQLHHLTHMVLGQRNNLGALRTDNLIESHRIKVLRSDKNNCNSIQT